MNIAVDSHTHSVASGHAFSTVDDLARGAHKRGLAAFVLTDHGPGMVERGYGHTLGNSLRRVLLCETAFSPIAKPS